MRKRTFSSMILSAFLAACLTVSVTGCGGSANTSGTSGTSDTSANSTVSAVQSTADNSTTADSQPTASTADTSAVRKLDVEKDIKLYTLGVNEVPYDDKFKDSIVTPADTATLITLLIDVPYCDDVKDQDIFLSDGREKRSPVKGHLFSDTCYNVNKNGSKDHSGFLYTISCSGKMQPSDFTYTFKLDGTVYSVSLPDTVTKTPDEFITVQETARVCNIVRLDGEDYFVSMEQNYSGNTLDADDNPVNFWARSLCLKHLDADVSTQADMTKFSYEQEADPNGKHDTSKIRVVIAQGKPFYTENYENRVYDQYIQYHFVYQVSDDMPSEERQALDDTAKWMTTFGYLVYNGQEGPVKITLF